MIEFKFSIPKEQASKLKKNLEKNCIPFSSYSKKNGEIVFTIFVKNDEINKHDFINAIYSINAPNPAETAGRYFLVFCSWGIASAEKEKTGTFEATFASSSFPNRDQLIEYTKSELKKRYPSKSAISGNNIHVVIQNIIELTPEDFNSYTAN